MATVKFNVKNVTLFGKKQTAEGSPATPASTNVLAVVNLEADPERDTEAFEYLGDSLSRDEITILKDTRALVKADTFVPVLGALNTGLAIDDAPFSHFLQSCGGFITIDGGTGKVTVDNVTASDEFVTLDYRKASSEVSVANTQKRTRYPDCRGSVDIAVETSSRATLVFNFLGNVTDPIMEAEVLPDAAEQSQQITNLSAVLRKSNIVTNTIQRNLGTQVAKSISNIDGDTTTVTVDFTVPHNLSVGDIFTVAGTTSYDGTGKVVATVTDSDTITYSENANFAAETTGTVMITAYVTSNLGFFSLTATNYFGFDYQRFLLTSIEGYTKAAVPTDVTVTVLDDEVGGTDFAPEANIENFYEVIIKYGTGPGKYVTYQFDKLQLATTKKTEVAQFHGQEISFRNTGKSYLIFD